MAAFIGKHRCQRRGCGKSFNEPRDLIAHIEQTHSDTRILGEVEGPRRRLRSNVEQVGVATSFICPGLSLDYQPVEKPTPEPKETRQEEMKRETPENHLSQIMPPPPLPSISLVHGRIRISGTDLRATTYQQVSRGGYRRKRSQQFAVPVATKRSYHTMASQSLRQPALDVNRRIAEIRSREDNSILWPITKSTGKPWPGEHVQTSAAEEQRTEKPVPCSVLGNLAKVGGEIQSREGNSSLWPIAESNGTPVEHVQMSAAEGCPKKPFPCSVLGNLAKVGGEIQSREGNSSLWPIAESNGTPVEHVQMSAAEGCPKKPFPCSVLGNLAKVGGEIQSREGNSSLWPIAESNGTPVEHVQMSAAEGCSKKPFPCSVSGCGKHYMYRSGLERHLRKVHGLDPHAPQIQVHKTARSLQPHFEKHHNNTLVFPQHGMKPKPPPSPGKRTQTMRFPLQPMPPPSPGNGAQAIQGCFQPLLPPSTGKRTQTTRFRLQPKPPPSSGKATQAMRVGPQPQPPPSPGNETQAMRVGLQPQPPPSPGNGTQAIQGCFQPLLPPSTDKRTQTTRFRLQPQPPPSSGKRTQAMRVGPQPQPPPSPGKRTQAMRVGPQPQPPPSPGNGTQAMLVGLQPQPLPSSGNGTQAMRVGPQPQPPPASGNRTQAMRVGPQPQPPPSSGNRTQAMPIPRCWPAATASAIPR